MDDATRTELKSIGEDCDGLVEEVEAALDEHAAFSYGLQVRVKVEELTKRYRGLVAGLPEEADKMEAERRVGRKVVDLQRMAVKLPAPPAGQPATKRASDEFFETREGKSSRKPFTPGLAPGAESQRGVERKKYQVSGDVDAWCGPCADVKTHTIIAMDKDEPVQVVCQVCGSRHRFRTESARKKGETTPPPSAARSSSAPAPGQQKMDEKNTFLNELRTAPNVRPFSPKERYRAGEIIEHPEHGRGKIENTLPRSLLVRFSVGLRPVKLT